jgi:peptidyl-prolyl cis-trans isomerase SurA
MARMDSIYKALLGGADFTELATKFSQDPGSARQGGQLPWLYAKQVYPEYANVAYSLKVGELSKPFLSPAGVHVVKLLDKKQFEPYSFHRADIHRFLEQRGVRQKAIEVKIDALYKQYGGKVKREDVLTYEEKELEKKYPEFRHLMQEYYDGLLLFEVSNREVWEKAAQDDKGLEKFFKKNKKKYAWDTPRFKGAILHCTTPEMLASAIKTLKKMDDSQWGTYVRKELNQDSLKLAFMEKGLFKIGQNANVDSLVFKQGAGAPKKEYPYAAYIGKVQKKYPGSHRDVRGPLTADYQKELEIRWIEKLRAKYPVEIYEEVLKTVNNH